MMFACACGKEFKYESEKKRHEISHNPQFECTECFKKFSFISALRRHQKQHKRTGNVQCSECSRNFRDENLLKRHIKYAHKETHTCSKCEAKFNSQIALLSHQKTHKPKLERRYHCSHNGCEKTFNFAHHLKHHELTHYAEKQHFCSTCGKGFIQLHHLKTHLKRHKPNSWLNCNIPGCLKTFTNAYALKRHLATHKEHMDFDEIYMANENGISGLVQKYKLLQDLSLKESTIAERIDNVQNIVNSNNNIIYSENLNTLSSTERLKSSNKTDEETLCQYCDCAKIKQGTTNKDNMPELKYNSDGTIKIKEFIDIDIPAIKAVKKEMIEDREMNRKDLSNKSIPYNSCKAVLGRCIVSGTGEECLCAKMAIDDSQMISQEIDELTPLPCQV